MQIDRPISIALILFVILLLVFFLVMPEYNTFVSLQMELGQKKAEQNAQVDYYAAITKTYYDLQSRQSDLQTIDDALPQESSLGRLVYFLQEAAKENGMIVKDLFLSKSSSNNASPSQTTDSVKDIVLSMDVLGNYSSLGSFMSSIEKSSRLFEVTNISFGSGSLPLVQPSQTQTQVQTQFQIQQTYDFNLQIKTHSY